MRARQLIAGGVLLAMAAAACGNSKSQTTKTTLAAATTLQPGETTSTADLTKNVPRPGVKGVTDTTIRVDAVIAITNLVGGKYGELMDGVQAYFDMVNAGGGIYGRKLEIVKVRDDLGGANKQETTNALAQDNAFATFGATYIAFTGADVLTAANQPAFVWNINPEFKGHNNIFANTPAICFGCVGATTPWIAKQLNKHRIGVLAYSVPSSHQCGQGVEASFKKYPSAQVVYTNYTLNFGQQLDAEVSKMKDAKVDFVLTCMDLHETQILGKAMKLQGLDAIQELPNGYDGDYIGQNADVYEGDVVGVQYTALEHQPQIPEIKTFLSWLQKSGKKFVELTATGWILADEFVTGLKLSGPEFTQQSVIDKLNGLAAYTDNGFLQPIDWSKGHIDPITHPEIRNPIECSNWVIVKSGKFQAIFDKPGKQWVCIDNRDATLNTVEYKTFAPSSG